MLASTTCFRLPESVTGRRISYASSDVFFFQGTLGDNLSLRPEACAADKPAYEGKRGRAARAGTIDEARKLSGNPEFDINSDWIDYARPPAPPGRDDLFTAIRPVLDAVLLSQDIIDLALRSSDRPRAPSRSCRAHRRSCARHCARRLEHRKSEQPGRALRARHLQSQEATIGENLLFGTAKGPALADKALASNPYFMSVLKDVRARRDALRHGPGDRLATPSNCSPTCHRTTRCSSSLTFMTPDEIPDYQIAAAKAAGSPYAAVSRTTTAPGSSR